MYSIHQIIPKQPCPSVILHDVLKHFLDECPQLPTIKCVIIVSNGVTDVINTALAIAPLINLLSDGFPTLIFNLRPPKSPPPLSPSLHQLPTLLEPQQAEKTRMRQHVFRVQTQIQIIARNKENFKYLNYPYLNTCKNNWKKKLTRARVFCNVLLFVPTLCSFFFVSFYKTCLSICTCRDLRRSLGDALRGHRAQYHCNAQYLCSARRALYGLRSFSISLGERETNHLIGCCVRDLNSREIV